MLPQLKAYTHLVQTLVLAFSAVPRKPRRAAASASAPGDGGPPGKPSPLLLGKTLSITTPGVPHGGLLSGSANRVNVRWACAKKSCASLCP